MLEFASIMILFPLLQQLLHNEKDAFRFLESSNFNFDSHSLHWSVLPITIVSIYLIKNTFVVWQAYQQLKFLDHLYLFFSERIFRNFYQQSWINYTNKNAAESFRQIKNTAYEYTHTVLQGLLIIVPELLICVIVVVTLVWISYKVFLVILTLFIPLLIFYIYLKNVEISKIDKSFRNLTPKTSIILSQGIYSFAEAKIYSKENYFIDSFIVLSKVTVHQLSRLRVFVNFPTKLTEVVGVVFFASAIAYSKLFPVNQSDFLFLLVLVSLVIYRVIPSVNKILNNLSQIQAYSFVASELEGVLKESKEVKLAKNQDISFLKSIEFRSISFHYNSNPNSFVLDTINFKINKGDFILLGGKSGAGKTTLLHMLAGLIDTYEGQLLIDERPLSSENIISWRKHLGFVPQSPIILQETFLKNIGFGMDEKDISVSRANEVIKIVGLNGLVNSFPLGVRTSVGENGLTISGGQKQRLALARALYGDPEILLLDEVTSQLDEQSKIELLGNLQKLNRQGKTIILISHDPLAYKFSSKALNLSEGGLKEVKQ